MLIASLTIRMARALHVVLGETVLGGKHFVTVIAFVATMLLGILFVLLETVIRGKPSVALVTERHLVDRKVSPLFLS